MVDIVDKQTRSGMMSGIQGKNTKPEILIRKALHGLGYRYRLYAKYLPGKPDLVLPKYCVVILVNGCFWHGHDCHLFKWPSTRKEFWKEKIGGTRVRDKTNLIQYKDSGWRVLTIWECALKGKTRRDFAEVIDEVDRWIKGQGGDLEIAGTG